MKRISKHVLVLSLIALFTFSTVIRATPGVYLRFSWWGSESRHKATMDAIELYMKKNPHLRIQGEYGGFNGYQQKLLTQLINGRAPDIMQIDQLWLGDLMNHGDLLFDMYHLKMLQLGGFDKNFLKNQCEWNGRLLGLPTGVNRLIFFANTDFFIKYQIPVNIQWDWDNLLEAGIKVQSQNKKAHLLMMDINHLGQMLKIYIKQHNGAEQWVNDDFSLGFDEKILTQAFTYYQRLLKSGTMAPLEETILFESKMEQNPGWIKSQIGLSQNDASAVFLYRLNGRLKLDVMGLPVLKGAKSSGITVRPSQLVALNKRSKNLKEAAKFLNWFFNDPEALLILKTERGIPATTTGRQILAENQLLDPIMVKGIELAAQNDGYSENHISNNNELVTIYHETLQKVGFNKLTPEAAAHLMVKEYQRKLAELKR